MESWIQSIGVAPVATLVATLCAVIVLMGRHIIQQQAARIEDQREAFRDVRELTVATNAAVSSASQAMTAAGASRNSAREAMQVATAVMQQRPER